MGDDIYNRYGAMADRAGSVARSSFSAYSEAPPLTSYPTSTSIDQWGVPPDYLQRDINSSLPGGYGYADIGDIGKYQESVIGAVTSEVSTIGFAPPLGDPLVSERREIADINHDRASSLRNAEVMLNKAEESNILFVDGLPTNCTRREVGHLFRPFTGYKDIRVVHKEPRRIGDKAMVLCFVEFVEAKFAQTAMKALQGYKFDDKKTDSPVLKIHSAHFPFRLPSCQDER